MNKLGLPTGQRYLKEFVNKVFLPAKRKQSNSFFYIPGVGRNSILRYMTTFKDKTVTEIDVNLGALLWLTVDYAKKEFVKDDWIRFLKLELKKEEFNDLIKINDLTEILEYITGKLKKRVLLCVLVSDDMDTSWLESLRKVNPLMIDFQFSFPFETDNRGIKNYLKNLTQFAVQNLWYMPLYKDEDIRMVIESQVNQGFVELDEEKTQKIIKLSGGYPRLARYFLRNLDKISVKSWKETEIVHFFDEIWDGLSDASHQYLFNFTDNTNKKPSEYLQKTLLLCDHNGKRKLFSPLFLQYIKNLNKSKKTKLNEKEGELEINGKKLSIVLSSQEENMFKYLWKNKGKVVNRDDVAKVLWGTNWEKNYSDWAIDQVIKRIRKKIGDRSKKSLIKTLRGKGFLIE